MSFLPLSIGICLSVFAGLLVCMTLAHRLGRARRRRHPGAGDQGQNTIESAVFGLLGLLLALTFFPELVLWLPRTMGYGATAS